MTRVKLALIAPGGTRDRSARDAPTVPSLALLTLAGMNPDRFEVSYHETESADEAGELPACDLAALRARRPS